MHISRNAVLLGFALLAGAAFAGPVTPTFTTFGPLPVATIGGSGIPNDRVAITTLGTSQDPRLTLALSATPRFTPPAVGDNGAGVYSALAGVSAVAPSPANPYALWNFNFYIGGSAVAEFAYSLIYDFDPSAGTDEALLGRTFAATGSIATVSQNSWNLGMDFLDPPAAIPGITPPAFATFDPNASGEYSFALVAFRLNDSQQLEEAARVAILVNVNAAPEPTSLALAGLALLAAGSLRRRR